MKTGIIAVVIIAILGIGGFALVKNGDKKDVTPTTNKSSYAKSNTNSDTTKATDSAKPASDATNSTSVSIKNFAFSPADITIKKGSTVTWTNNDQTAHTVTETDGQDGPKSADLNQGKSYSFTYSTVGTFKYNCSIHPHMTGSVTVTE